MVFARLSGIVLLWSHLFCVCLLTLAFASDHIDGEITRTEPLADLSDFYAFPSQDGAALSMILNTYPIAHSGAHFSERIGYAFEIRSAVISEGTVLTPEGIRIECVFQHEHGAGHFLRCEGDNGLNAETTEDQVGPDGVLKVFFGRRSDPFFFNSDWATETSTEGRIAESDGENTMSALNALSLAVQIDRSALPGQGLLALAVEAFTDDGGQRRYLDRIGRPEITNVTLIHRGSDEDIRDAMNQQPAFGFSETVLEKKRARLNDAIAYYDALDGQTDWTAEAAGSLTELLLDDFLLLDLSMPCDGDQFFQIERSLLDGKSPRSCGGRKPEDDLIDRLYSLYIANDRVAIGDGVDAPQTPTSPVFPHLAAPETGFWSWFKTWLGNRRAR